MKAPRWPLSEEYALDVDRLNWQLRQKVHHKKEGTYAYKNTWKIIGYYPTLKLLAEGLQRFIVLNVDNPDLTLKEHLEEAIAVSQAAITALEKQREALGIGMTTLSPGYAKFDLDQKL